MEGILSTPTSFTLTKPKENAMKLTVTLHKVKETKGAVRYEESNWRNRPDYAIGTLYIRKEAFNVLNQNVFPPTITVTVEA